MSPHPARAKLLGAVAIALLALAALACASGPPGVQLSGDWPAETGDYDDVTDRWTRHDSVRGDIGEGLTEIAAVDATLLSPQWRAAYVEKRARDEKLAPAETQALAAAQRERHEAYYEVMILIRAHQRRLIDFEKGDRSVWRVVLSDGRGNEIEATSIERDRRIRSVVAEFFPDLSDFERPYLARFSRGEVELFGPDAESIELRLASPRATLEVSWDGR